MVSSTLWRSTQSCGGNHPPWFPVETDVIRCWAIWVLFVTMGMLWEFFVVCYIYKRVWGQHPWYPVFLLKTCKHVIKVNCMFWTLYSITWDEPLRILYNCGVLKSRDEHNFWTSGRRTRMWACLGCVPGRRRWKWVTTSAAWAAERWNKAGKCARW